MRTTSWSPVGPGGPGGLRRPLGWSPRWGAVVAPLNPVLRGWAHYFSYGTRLMAYRAVDHCVYEGVRHFLRRRHTGPSRGTRRFPLARVFGELGVVPLRRLRLGSPAHAGVKNPSESRV